MNLSGDEVMHGALVIDKLEAAIGRNGAGNAGDLVFSFDIGDGDAPPGHE